MNPETAKTEAEAHYHEVYAKTVAREIRRGDLELDDPFLVYLRKDEIAAKLIEGANNGNGPTWEEITRLALS